MARITLSVSRFTSMAAAAAAVVPVFGANGRADGIGAGDTAQATVAEAALVVLVDGRPIGRPSVSSAPTCLRRASRHR